MGSSSLSAPIEHFLAMEPCIVTTEGRRPTSRTLETVVVAHQQQGGGGLSWERKVELLKQMARGFRWLHGNSELSRCGLTHRDLKPANVLVKDVGGGADQIKIADFGSAKLRSKDTRATTGGIGTEGWIAPESMGSEGATPAGDIFSLGLVFFFVLSGGRHVFGEDLRKRARKMIKFAGPDPDDSDDDDDVAAVDERVRKAVREGLRGCGAEDEGESAAELLCAMLRRAPSARPTAEEVAKHGVFRAALDSFSCPLSLEVMKDPVVCADGQTYERSEIEAWFATGKTTSPLTGVELESRALIPNVALRRAIAES